MAQTVRSKVVQIGNSRGIRIPRAMLEQAGLTGAGRDYPTRASCQLAGKAGQIVLDQLRTVDQARLVKKLGVIEAAAQRAVLAVLAQMFAE